MPALLSRGVFFLCSKMRILAAGGDGTVAWILKTIRDLGLDPEPHVAVMPLGTGNDLSLSFGWGNTFLKSWINVSVLVAFQPHLLLCMTLAQNRRSLPVRLYRSFVHYSRVLHFRLS